MLQRQSKKINLLPLKPAVMAVAAQRQQKTDFMHEAKRTRESGEQSRTCAIGCRSRRHRFGVAVTRYSRSARLLYIQPG